MKKIGLIFLIVSLFTACSPKIVKLEQIARMDGKLSATITVIRNDDVIGFGIRYYPTINGEKVAGLYRNEYTEFDVLPGEYKFGVSIFTDRILGGRWTLNEINRVVEANHKYFFILGSSFPSPSINDLSDKEGIVLKEGGVLVPTGIRSGVLEN